MTCHACPIYQKFWTVPCGLTCPTCQILWRALLALRGLRAKQFGVPYVSYMPTCQKFSRLLQHYVLYVPKILECYLESISFHRGRIQILANIQFS